MESGKICGGGGDYGGGDGYLGKGSTTSENGTIKKLAGKMNGFWLRHAIGICSTRRDVVEPMEVGRLRQGKLDNC